MNLPLLCWFLLLLFVLCVVLLNCIVGAGAAQSTRVARVAEHQCGGEARSHLLLAKVSGWGRGSLAKLLGEWVMFIGGESECVRERERVIEFVNTPTNNTNNTTAITTSTKCFCWDFWPLFDVWMRWDVCDVTTLWCDIYGYLTVVTQLGDWVMCCDVMGCEVCYVMCCVMWCCVSVVSDGGVG